MKKLLLICAGLAALAAVAGNTANPDAIELAPIPSAIEFTSNIDAPVAFDATAKVVVECADAAAVEWLNRHFAEWYGAYAPKCAAGATELALRAGDEAYAVAADASGVKIAARTLAGVDYLAQIGGFGLLETTWHHLRGNDWIRMYRFASCAAWGTPVRGTAPMFDTAFANALRMVGHDMKVMDYLDTGHLNYQVPPGWWVDNN